MASIGSVSPMESSVLLHSGNHHRPPRFSFSTSQMRKSVDYGSNEYSGVGYLKIVGEDSARSCLWCERLSVGCSRGHGWRIKCVEATGKGSVEGDSDDESEDAIQATMEKSKKVLAMQRDLLQQIAERKKLVSSIKSSIVDSEEVNDGGPYKDVDNSFPNLDIPSVDEKSTDNYSSNFSSSFVQSPSDEVQGKVSPHVNSDFPKKSETADSGKLWSDAFPSFGTKTSEDFGIKDKLLEDLKELSGNEAYEDANSPISDYEKPPPLAGTNVMNVILVAAECAPWSKTGGLGDVAGALPKALARRGHRVMVVAPRYGNYVEPQDTGVRKRYKVDGQDMEVTYFHAYIDGVDFVFMDTPMFRNKESNIYGGNRLDILKRMVLFCKAAVEVPWYVPCGGVCYGDGNLVFIANDWHTALLPVYLKAYYRDNGLMKYTRSILVIHNIAHQGRGPLDDFIYTDLPQHYVDLFKLYDPVGGEHFNIFAAGLKTADRVVTVSHGYAWELKTQEGGWGLHNIINENDWKLKGIVNGIDTKEWSPQSDVHLRSDGYSNYSLETLHIGKAKCKEALQKELGLPVRPDVPLIGFIGRLDQQKGVDLIAEAIPWMMGQDVQLVMLGTGRSDLEQMLRQFENQHHDKIRGWVGFSVKTAHRITAGCDMLLMPSRFEPCGLNQLYAMMYGTIPVVHAVGGLRDTVQPFDPFSESGLGWTFDRAEVGRLIHALGNCLLTYRDYKKSWEGLQTRGMKQDLSWDHAAQNYEEVLVAAKYQW